MLFILLFADYSKSVTTSPVIEVTKEPLLKNWSKSSYEIYIDYINYQASLFPIEGLSSYLHSGRAYANDSVSSPIFLLYITLKLTIRRNV